MATLAEILKQSPAEINFQQFFKVDNADKVFTKKGALTTSAQTEVIASLAAKAEDNPASSVFENLHKKAVEACKIGETEISFTKDSWTAKSTVVKDEDSDDNDTVSIALTSKAAPVVTVLLNKQAAQGLLLCATKNKEHANKLAEISATTAGKDRMEVLTKYMVDLALDPQNQQLLKKMEESGNLKASLDILPPPEPTPTDKKTDAEMKEPLGEIKKEETSSTFKQGDKEGDDVVKVDETKKTDTLSRIDETKKTDTLSRIDETKETDTLGRIDETKETDTLGRIDETNTTELDKKIKLLKEAGYGDADAEKQAKELLTKKSEPSVDSQPKPTPKKTVEMKKPLQLQDDEPAVKWLDKAVSREDQNVSDDLAFLYLSRFKPEQALSHLKALDKSAETGLFKSDTAGTTTASQLLEGFRTLGEDFKKPAAGLTKTIVQAFGKDVECLKDFTQDGNFTPDGKLTAKVLQMGTDQFGKFTPAQVQESLELTKQLVSELHSDSKEGVLQQAMTLQYKAPQQVTLWNLLKDLGTGNYTPDALHIKNLISDSPKDSATLREKSGTKSLLEANKEESWIKTEFPQESYVYVKVNVIHVVMGPAKATTEGQTTVHTAKFSAEQAGALQSLAMAMRAQAKESDLKKTEPAKSMKVAAAVDMKPGKNIVFTEDTTKAPDVALHLKVQNPTATSVMIKGMTSTTLDPQDTNKTQENAFHALMAKTQEGETTAIIQGTKSPVPVDLMDNDYNPIPHATSNTASEVFAMGTVVTA